MPGLFSSYGMFGDLKAIRADIVSYCIGVHSRPAVDGIAWLRDGVGRRAQCDCCSGEHDQAFHDHLHGIPLKSEVESGAYLPIHGRGPARDLHFSPPVMPESKKDLMVFRFL